MAEQYATDDHGNRRDTCGWCVQVPTTTGWARATQAGCPEHGSQPRTASRTTVADELPAPLSAEPTTIHVVLSAEEFDALTDRLDEPDDAPNLRRARLRQLAGEAGLKCFTEEAVREAEARVRAQVAEERDTLARGWRSLLALDKHAVHCGGPIDDPDYCPGCSKYAAGLFRGEDRRDLRCPAAQRWQRDVEEARDLALATTATEPGSEGAKTRTEMDLVGLDEAFTLSGDEDGGVGIVCARCDSGGLPVAYCGWSNAYAGVTEVRRVQAISGLLAAALDHLAAQHATEPVGQTEEQDRTEGEVDG